MRQARILRLASGGVLHVAGPAAGPPALFLHGVGGGAWSWSPQRDALATHRRTYVWEARGHGVARVVADAGLSDYYLDATEALAAVVACDGPAFVVGHSMGGLLALALAAERPTQTCGLVLVDPVYAPDGGTHLSGPVGRIARKLMEPLVASMMRDGVLARTLARAIFAQSFVDRDARDAAWLGQRTQVPTEYPKMMYEAFDGPTGFPSRAFARELSVPTLLVEPRSTRGPRFPRLVAELEPLGERFRYITLSGGHYLQLDRSAARVTRAIDEFLGRWSR